MLETKFVKHLQSRPKHMRVGIFALTMATAGLVLFSFLTASLRNTFLAATESKLEVEQVAVADDDVRQKENQPSLLSNMKANIGELADMASGMFAGSENKTQSGLSKESVRKIKPVRLPTSE